MYTSHVSFEWDEAKRKTNFAKHGIDFPDVPEMVTSLMLVAIDTCKDYGEPRKIGFGFIRGRLMVVAFTEREPNSIRIISARKANTREEDYYQKTVADELGKN